MPDFPTYCPYCRHNDLRVRITAWAVVTNGELQTVEHEAEMSVLDTNANAVCARCGGKFTWHPKTKT